MLVHSPSSLGPSEELSKNNTEGVYSDCNTSSN